MSHFRIARRLSASAGVLEAYLGVEVESDRPVLVKRLVDPWAQDALGFGQRLVGQVAAARGAPAVPAWLEVGVARSSVWLVQALHEGESLRSLMNTLAEHRGFITPNEGLGLLGVVASRVAALHGRSPAVVHADLCASTVLVTPGGEVWLTDAGVTRAIAPLPGAGPPRAEAWSLAPEQLAGGSSEATDVFRLGLMLYELAVGQPLFFAPDSAQALAQVQRFSRLDQERIKQVPEPWRSLMVQALKLDPRERPAAAEVDAVLQQAAARAGWQSALNDIARLFARTYPGRQSLADLARGGTQDLVLGPLPSRSSPTPRPAPALTAAPVARVTDEARAVTTGSFQRLPPVPTPPAPAATPAPTAPTPGATSTSGGFPSVTPSTNAVVGRINTRKMSRAELSSAQQPEAPAAQSASPPPEDPRAPRDARVGELLVEKGVITRAQCDEARAQVVVYGGTVADALVAMGVIDEDTIVMTVADLTRTPFTTLKKLSDMTAPADALALVPMALARSLDLVPLGLKGGTQLMVAMKDPMDGAALEQLKAATGLKSIVAVRSGEHAIRKTRNRFYTGTDDSRPDWLERNGRSAPTPMPAAEVPTVTGALLLTPSSGVQVAPPAEVSLEAPAGRLVTALLSAFGERGQQAIALTDFAGSLALRLGLSAAEVEHTRFAATTVCVANLVEGRPAFDVPSVGSLSAVLGERGWNLLEGTLGAWLDWPAGIPPSGTERAVCVAFAFALHSGLPLPRGSKLGGALVSFKTRFQVEAGALELISRALGPPG